MSRYRKNSNNFSIVLIILVLVAGISLLAYAGSMVFDFFGEINENQNNNSGNGNAADDPSACKHATLSTTYTLEGDSTHRTVSVCQDCKKIVKDEAESHVYDGDGKCKMGDCGYQCKHGSGTVVFFKYANVEEHQRIVGCKVCLAAISSELVAHSFDDAGVCQTVGCEYTCMHSNGGVSYVEVKSDDDLHMEKGSCTVCGVSFGEGTGAPHIYRNGVCARCNHTCKHTSMSIQYDALNDGTHNVVSVCPHGCGLDSTEKQKCVYPADGSGICASCDAEHPHVVTADATYIPDTVTATHHYLIYVCEGCGKSVTEAELHNFVDEESDCACGHHCDHEVSQSFVVSGMSEIHVVLRECELCGECWESYGACDLVEISSTVDKYGHKFVHLCTICGFEYPGMTYHDDLSCGYCEECGTYAKGSKHGSWGEGVYCEECWNMCEIGSCRE